MLYLMIHDLPLAPLLPPAWRDKWNRVAGDKLPPTFHDPDPGYPPVPNREEISHRNRQVTRRLLDVASHYWF